jgi:hypothetical protein
MESRGSVDLGPSEEYVALLRGDITAEEYVEKLEARVDGLLSRQDRIERRQRIVRREGRIRFLEILIAIEFAILILFAAFK